MANLFYSVDEAYRDGTKAAWLMTSTTLAKISSLVDKQGHPLILWQGPQGFLFGKPIRISPSMSQIGNGNAPIIFGDLSYYVVRASIDPLTRVVVYRETIGLVENGLIGLRAFVRYDGQYLFNNAGGSNPCAYLANQT